MGWNEAAGMIRSAVRKAIASGRVTRDFFILMEKEGRKGECLSTSAFTEEIIGLLR